MTTIAASLDFKQIAADCKCSSENPHFEVHKLRELPDGSVIGAAGDWGVILKLYRGDTLDEDADIDVLKISHTGLHLFDTRTGVFFPIMRRFFAIGSGSEYAIAAMACGKSPKEAVALAARFDSDTGHPIDVMALKRKKGVSNGSLAI
jgi:ATP-dependent protease HslVU (ClpYQ) peptidase subunit